MRTLKLILPCVAALMLLLGGCGDGGGTTDGGEGGSSAANDHEHPVHGPNGGHTVVFAETHDLHAEWKHYNDSDIIRFYVLDEDCKNSKAVHADSFTVKRTTGDSATFTLEPENPDADGLAEVYSLDDEALATAMNLGTTVEMKIGDKVYTAEIPAHAPHDH